MWVALFGNGDLAVRIFERLAAQRDVETFVVLNPDDLGRAGEPGPSLAEAVARRGAEAIRPRDGNRREVVRFLERVRPALLVCAETRTILAPEVLRTATVDAVNFHDSLLPRHRGCRPVAWTLASGDAEAGVTVHRLDLEANAGPIVEQVAFPVAPEATCAEVARACADCGLALFDRLWTAWADGKRPPGRAQDVEAASYHGWAWPSDRWIQWDQPVAEVRRLIHALTDGVRPAGRTRCGGRVLEVLGPVTVEGAAAAAAPGTVRHAGDTVAITCGGGAVQVASCRVAGRVVAARELLPDGATVQSPARQLEGAGSDAPDDEARPIIEERFNEVLPSWTVNFPAREKPTVGGGGPETPVSAGETMPSKNPLTGEKVRLRPFEASDAAAYRAWVNDPEIMELVDRALPVTEVEHQRWYEGMVTNRSVVAFALDRLDRQALIGAIWLYDVEARHRRGELRIVIGDRECWGKGYGTESIALLLRYAFEALNLHKVYAYVLATNPRAVKAFKAAGFEEEGLLREDRYVGGRYVDVVRLGAIRKA